MKLMRSVSARAQDYLKSIYLLQEGGESVTSKMLCAEMKVRAPTVTSMLKKLDSDRFIDYTKYGSIALTHKGIEVALEVVRHHRLLETFFSRILGFGLHEVHEEADELEHIISENLEEKIFDLLGHPNHDPHGSPIPGKDGSIPTRELRSLVDLEEGEIATIGRLLHRSPEQLKYLEKSGLVPGASVTLVEKKPFNGPIVFSTGEIAKEYISYEFASKILVFPAPTQEYAEEI